jgi:glutaredoxin
MIEIYGNETCSYCLRSKRLADTYALQYEWLDTDIPKNLDTLRLRQRLLDPIPVTIPQIWWHGKYIGGYDDFAKEIEETLGGFGDGTF